MKKILLRLTISLILIIGIAVLCITLLYNGYIRFNYPSYSNYPVQGIDVSHHQYDINWSLLDKKQVQFAFIKATEGGDFIDRNFQKNWDEAKKQNIIVGAYHFFTFCRDPKEQAQNFIAVVPNDSLMLPPAIDLEYGGNCKLTKSKMQLLQDITTFIDIVEQHYNKQMIIYVTGDFYEDIVVGNFKNNPLWMRNIYRQPQTTDNRDWLFWQFANKGRLDGIETLVDINVFGGSEQEFRNLIESKIK